MRTYSPQPGDGGALENRLGNLEHKATYAATENDARATTFGELDVSVTARRGFAALTDTAILGVVLLFFLRAFGLHAARIVIDIPFPGPYKSIPHHWVLRGFYLSPGPLIAFAAVCLFYFTIFEAAFGCTPGKLLFGIRVVDFYGGRPSMVQSLLRNGFRILDGYPFVVPNLVGLAILLSNRRHQRGGDKAAGTLVVDRRSSAAERAIRKMRIDGRMPDKPLGDEVWT